MGSEMCIRDRNYGWFNIGSASLHVSDTVFDNCDAYQVEVSGQTIGFLSLFAKVDDTWGAFIEKSDLLPLLSYSDINEGSYMSSLGVDNELGVDGQGQMTMDELLDQFESRENPTLYARDSRPRTPNPTLYPRRRYMNPQDDEYVYLSDSSEDDNINFRNQRPLEGGGQVFAKMMDGLDEDDDYGIISDVRDNPDIRTTSQSNIPERSDSVDSLGPEAVRTSEINIPHTPERIRTVSYTHLTLPTNREV